MTRSDLSNQIVAILRKGPADQYEIHKKIDIVTVADISRAIAELLMGRTIHVSAYRKSERLGVDIPIYSLKSPRKARRLDLHSILIGVSSERTVEYDFVSRNLVSPSRHAILLDVGAAGSSLGSHIQESSHGSLKVIGIDIVADPLGTNTRMDVRDLGFRDRVFDQALCISTIEHVGLSVNDPADIEFGDHQAMQEISRVLKKDGTVILTVPYSALGKIRNKSALKIHRATMVTRVYDKYSLSYLVKYFIVQKKEFYCYQRGKWTKCTQTMADKYTMQIAQDAQTQLPLAFHSPVCACLLLRSRHDHDP